MIRLAFLRVDSILIFWKAHYVQFVSKLPEKNANPAGGKTV